MAQTALEKFRSRLALADYFRSMFGVPDVQDPDAVDAFYSHVNQLDEGYTAEGRSHVADFIATQADTDVLTPEQLFRYDTHLRRHTGQINTRRPTPITLKPFQILAALMTDAYLDRVAHRVDTFLQTLNAFVADHNQRKGRISYPAFDHDDLHKIAFWMATGSGKTLLMHLNYYQYLHYAETDDAVPDNILLVTPNEGLSQQHIEELQHSSIPCRQFNADTADRRSATDHCVKVIEIQKLVDTKTDGGQSIEVAAFTGENVVFVDEGHKGAGSTAQTWRNRRETLAADGFTFEYSATFGQAVAGSPASVQNEYGRAILFDYSYPRFHAAGYGKDYNILNLDNALDAQVRRTYLLANLLTYYQQVYVYTDRPRLYRDTYNVKHPLLVFIGHSVNAGKSRGSLGKNDEQSLSDVEEVLVFLADLLQNEDNWVPETINRLLDSDTSVTADNDLFHDLFSALRESGQTGEPLYDQLLQDVFHTDTATGLELVDITGADGEVGIRARAADTYFGVINIGNDTVFLERAADYDRFSIEEDHFTDSLFHRINAAASDITVLIGSRKFIEGWDSWRVSTMGLMNFGRGAGPQVIQLFGRGVRLLGKNRMLKRSTHVSGTHPPRLPLLETLNIFGVRADYMAQFREYLASEGIDPEAGSPPEQVQHPGESPSTDGQWRDVAVRFRAEAFVDLEATPAVAPVVDIGPQFDAITSSGTDRGSEPEERENREIPDDLIPLLDWTQIYLNLLQFKQEKNYSNMVLGRQTLRDIIDNGYYTLQCPRETLAVESFEELSRIQELVVMILRKYVQVYYRRERDRWNNDGEVTVKAEADAT